MVKFFSFFLTPSSNVKKQRYSPDLKKPAAGPVLSEAMDGGERSGHDYLKHPTLGAGAHRAGDVADHWNRGNDLLRKATRLRHYSWIWARKILITGGLWSTERSREVAELFEQYGSVKRVAEELGLSPGLVITYLPYQKTVYDLEEKSGNAKRIDRWRERHR